MQQVGKEVTMRVQIACSLGARLRGLMGRDGFEGALLIAPCHDIHTFGMARPIDVAFLARDGTVVEAHRNVGPRRRLACRRAVATLERFADTSDWLESGDVVRLSGG